MSIFRKIMAGTSSLSLSLSVLLAALAVPVSNADGEESAGNPVLTVKSVYGDLNLKLKEGKVGAYPYNSLVAEQISFKIAGKYEAWLILPKKTPPAGMRPWVWFAPQTMGTNTWIWERLLDAGFAIGGVAIGETNGNPEGRKVYTEFYETVTGELGLDAKVCLMPGSRGGLMLYNWAAEHPDAVRCVGGIYPVCDITAWCTGFSDICKSYGLTEDEMRAQLPKHNPIERLEGLAARKIPIFHVTGDKDNAVPMERNSLEMQRRYLKLGGQMEVDVIPGKGHQECPEIYNSQKMVDFFLKYGLKPVK